MANRPSRMIAKATTKRAQPGKLMPPYRRRAHAVTGHAANPENKANQPLVGGQGPKVTMRPRPPMIVSNPQPQATAEDLEDLFDSLRLASRCGAHRSNFIALMGSSSPRTRVSSFAVRETSKLFVRARNETLPVAAMRVHSQIVRPREKKC